MAKANAKSRGFDTQRSIYRYLGFDSTLTDKAQSVEDGRWTVCRNSNGGWTLVRWIFAFSEVPEQLFSVVEHDVNNHVVFPSQYYATRALFSDFDQHGFNDTQPPRRDIPFPSNKGTFSSQPFHNEIRYSPRCHWKISGDKEMNVYEIVRVIYEIEKVYYPILAILGVPGK